MKRCMRPCRQSPYSCTLTVHSRVIFLFFLSFHKGKVTAKGLAVEATMHFDAKSTIDGPRDCPRGGHRSIRSSNMQTLEAMLEELVAHYPVNTEDFYEREKSTDYLA